MGLFTMACVQGSAPQAPPTTQSTSLPLCMLLPAMLSHVPLQKVPEFITLGPRILFLLLCLYEFCLAFSPLKAPLLAGSPPGPHRTGVCPSAGLLAVLMQGSEPGLCSHWSLGLFCTMPSTSQAPIEGLSA